jgi:hypothetical protein
VLTAAFSHLTADLDSHSRWTVVEIGTTIYNPQTKTITTTLVSAGQAAGAYGQLKVPIVRELVERLAQEHQLEEALQKQSPLEFLLEVMRDGSYPPGSLGAIAV